MMPEWKQPSRQPKLSVVIATYMDGANLRDTLLSVARQSTLVAEVIEVVVVDGGSTDNTKEVVSSFGALVTTFISEPDHGVYDAMNKGARLSKGKWLHFLNAGDSYSSDQAVAMMLDVVEQGDRPPLWAVCGARHLGGGTRGPVLIRNLPHRWLYHAYGFQPHCHQACWFDREFFVRLGGHDLEAGLVGDFDYIFRIGLLEVPVEVKQVLIDYQGGGMSHQRRTEIPLALHRVRRKRMGLSGFATRLDYWMTIWIARYLRIRAGAGRVKGRAASVLGSAT